MATLKKMQEQAEKMFLVVKGTIAMYGAPFTETVRRDYPIVPEALPVLNSYTITVEPNGKTHCNTADHKIVLSGLQLDQLATEIYDRLVTRDHKYKQECLRDACEYAAIAFACTHEVMHVVVPYIFDELYINAATFHYLRIGDLLGGYPEDAEMLEVLEEIALGVKY